MRRTLSNLHLLAAVGLVAACATGDIANPIGRKLNWFGYLNGDDLRPTCAAGNEAYRFVYNADYAHQVRIYDIVARADGRADMTVRVLGPATVAEITLDPADLDVMAPWRGTTATATLGPADVARLRRDIASLEVAPRGLEVTSDQTYWVIGGCLEGVYRFNLLPYPSPRFEALTADDLLFERDHSGVAVAAPKTAARRLPGAERDDYPVHRLRVGDNGLWGVGRPF